MSLFKCKIAPSGTAAVEADSTVVSSHNPYPYFDQLYMKILPSDIHDPWALWSGLKGTLHWLHKLENVLKHRLLRHST